MNDTANRAITESAAPYASEGFNAGEPCPRIRCTRWRSRTCRSRDPRFVVVCYRIAEFVVALTALVLALPVILLEALIIKLDSPGPAFFFHTRYGRSRIVRGADLVGRTDIAPVSGTFDRDKLYWVPTYFKFVKFRTMYHDARQRFPELYRFEFKSAAEFHAGYYKLDNDPRVTRAGRWLRKLTVDELPNLWHVVRGDIALVGSAARRSGPSFRSTHPRNEEIHRPRRRHRIAGDQAGAAIPPSAARSATIALRPRAFGARRSTRRSR